LASELVRVFGIKKAIVVSGEGLSAELLRRRIGIACADYLHTTLNEGCQFGIGWGRTLCSVVEALDSREKLDIHVVPLIGGLGQISSSFQVNELARQLASAFGGSWHPFYVPAFVEDPAALDGLLRLPDVQAVIQAWAHIDTALVGIGHFASQHQSSMLFYNYIGKAALQGRVIGIPLESLKALREVIGVAGATEKAPAILGALRGGFVDVLVTDSVAARTVLELNRGGAT
jgi:DNA-binding transcriptional regulator LsrR (DeoR family)